MNTDKKLHDDWIEAGVECDSNKRSTTAYKEFKQFHEGDFYNNIIPQIINRCYNPECSDCFCVTKPKLREIFAANYGDRYIQHWITHRLEPLFEKRFIEQGNVSYNCRKGFGVQAAVLRTRDYIVEMTDNYNKDAYIGKFDLKGFFMSIDKDILWNNLEIFIRKEYKESDIELLLYLTKVVVYHCPQKNCKKRGDLALFEKLPIGKTLFKQPDNIGLPIGNITSQLFANFYMSFFDEFANNKMAEIGGRYIRFVDDFIIVAPRKKSILKLRAKMMDYLESELHVKLHRDKVYLQKVNKGVKFVGYVIKPHRLYLSNKTFHTLSKKLCLLNKYALYLKGHNEVSEDTLDELRVLVNAINSCIGFSRPCHFYKRVKAEIDMYPDILYVVDISKTNVSKDPEIWVENYKLLKIKPQFNLMDVRFNNYITERYGSKNNYQQPEAIRNRAFRHTYTWLPVKKNQLQCKGDSRRGIRRVDV